MQRTVPARTLAHFLADSFQFVEYDQRAHRLNTLASFTFWVSSNIL